MGTAVGPMAVLAVFLNGRMDPDRRPPFFRMTGIAEHLRVMCLHQPSVHGAVDLMTG